MTEEIKEIELYNDGKGTNITLFDLHSDLEGRTNHKIEVNYMGALSESKLWNHNGQLGSLVAMKNFLDNYFSKVKAIEDIKTKEDIADWIDTYVGMPMAKLSEEHRQAAIKQAAKNLEIAKED